MNEKLQKYKEYLENANISDTLGYLFKSYFEETDEELKDFFFNKIGEFILERKYINSKANQVIRQDKDLIINAAYKYIFEDVSSLRGPLKNAFSGILNETNDEVFISPFLNLINITLKHQNLEKKLKGK